LGAVEQRTTTGNPSIPGDVEVEAVVGEIGKRAMEVGELPMRRI